MRKKFDVILLTILFLFSLAACGGQTQQVPPTIEINDVDSDIAIENYPAPSNSSSDVQSELAYPVESSTNAERLTEPPNPDVALPDGDASEYASMGGVLIQEFFEDETYIPLNPSNIFLGNVLQDQNGLQTHVVIDSKSAEAELLNTGVFIFRNITPGTYGMIVDLGFTQFVMKNEQGDPLILSLSAGDAVDLGQLFVSNDDF